LPEPFVGLEVGIGRKNLPSAPQRDGTDQEIGVAAGNAAGTATIRALRGQIFVSTRASSNYGFFRRAVL
jgi:hypothetical protein